MLNKRLVKSVSILTVCVSTASITSTKHHNVTDMTEQGACLIIILNVRQALLALHLDSITQVIVQAVKQRLPNVLPNSPAFYVSTSQMA